MKPQPPTRPSVLVAQLGARRQYAVPRLLHQAAMLDRFLTDLYAGQSLTRLLDNIPAAARPALLNRLLGRNADSLPPPKVKSLPAFGLQYAFRRKLARPGQATALHLWAGREFCRHAIAIGFGQASAVYTFNTAGLELMRAARERGLKTVTDQTIAPRRVEERLLRIEREKWPDWRGEHQGDPCLDEYMEREEQEWDTSDLIICGSEFVREGIAQCGGPVSRCAVAAAGPAARVAERRNGEPRARNGAPLRVLTVGAVGLRKGSPYVFAAARLLAGRCVFRMVGPLDAPSKALKSAPANVQLWGPVPHCQMPQHYAWADVFLLPSICEGASMACREAQAAALPVICTRNTGTQVIDGRTGYLVSPGDVEAISARLETLATAQRERREMSREAAGSASQWAVAEDGGDLVRAVRALFM